MIRKFIALATFVLLLVVIPMNVLATTDSQCDGFQTYLQLNIVNAIEYDTGEEFPPVVMLTIITAYAQMPDGTFVRMEWDRPMDDYILAELASMPFGFFMGSRIVSRCVNVGGWPWSLQFEQYRFHFPGEQIHNVWHVDVLATCPFCGTQGMYMGSLHRVGTTITVVPDGFWVRYSGTISFVRPLYAPLEDCCG